MQIVAGQILQAIFFVVRAQLDLVKFSQSAHKRMCAEQELNQSPKDYINHMTTNYMHSTTWAK